MKDLDLPSNRNVRNKGSNGVSPSEEAVILEKHNDLRRNVQPTASNMLEMAWSKEAAANAQRWAETCAMAHSAEGQRRISSSGCGENIYMSDHKDSWSHAIQAWYNEFDNWQYGSGSINGKPVGHFTQVVWYRSNLVGCGVAHCPEASYHYFYVCQYCPPGNYQFTHPYKKGAHCGACPDSCDNQLCTNPCPYSDKYGNCPGLAKKWGCSNGSVAAWCRASCACSDKIK
ncbi:cysteine-rich secretory protein 2-like [Xyrichtys novacula]|nr:cysteine-rich secretory protein 2-like [Xyrichtys novacula]